MSRHLICVFSYNRMSYLTNAANSIDRFVPFGDRIVFDDGSDAAESTETLKQIASRSRWRVIVSNRKLKNSRAFGGFYRNMAKALKFAVDEGYDFCWFIEDDQQFVWRNENQAEYVEHVFRNAHDAIQLIPLFFRRILDYSNRLEFIGNVGAYRSDRGFNTTAIWNLDVVRRHPDYEVIHANGDDLPSNSIYWVERGYRAYFQHAPTLAVMPWGHSTWRIGDLGAAQDDTLILNSLSPSEIKYLKERNPEILAYQEYFNLSPSNLHSPIWHRKKNSIDVYLARCRSTVLSENRHGQSPIRIPALPNWTPCSIEPEQSHSRYKSNIIASQIKRNSDKSFVTKVFEKLEAIVQRAKSKYGLSVRGYYFYLNLRRRLRREQRSLPYTLSV